MSQPRHEQRPETGEAGARTLVVIFGPPAVGKMTVGHELSTLTGLPLFHNHLTIEPLLRFFPFGHPSFRRLTTEFRTRLFEEVAAAPEHSGLIFTYVWALDEPGDRTFIEHLTGIFTAVGARVCYVELAAALEERLRRNESEFRLAEKPSKRELAASRDRLLENDRRYRLNTAGSDLDFFPPGQHLRLETTAMPAAEAARRIVEHFGLTPCGPSPPDPAISL